MGRRAAPGLAVGHRLLWIVKPSMVIDRCFVWTITKFLVPELYLEASERSRRLLLLLLRCC